jgi:ribokinase
VIVFGQIARDLILVVDSVPAASRSADVYQRRELLGGKGANQAVGLAQLGMRTALAGVVGEDQVGQRLLTQASQDRVDVSAVARRPGARTALIVDIVDGTGEWRYLEGIPAEMLLTEADVMACRHLFLPGRWVSVQLQQPPAAALAAVTLAHRAGCKVVLDGRQTTTAGTRYWPWPTYSAPTPGRRGCWSARLSRPPRRPRRPRSSCSARARPWSRWLSRAPATWSPGRTAACSCR